MAVRRRGQMSYSRHSRLTISFENFGNKCETIGMRNEFLDDVTVSLGGVAIVF